MSIRAATRRFGATIAVDALSLDVPDGEILALVGPDGAGKTTLLRLVCGALAPDAGEISVGDIDVCRDPARVQATIGYMPQRFSLYPDLSGRENLRFYGDVFGVASAEFRSRSETLLTDFALAQFADRPAGELSGGMKQKLALACTLIHSPPVILLDEPTAGVDPISRREFWRILYAINRSGTTLLVSTPYMDEAERATRVAFIVRGKILIADTPAALKAHVKGDIVEVRCERRGEARAALRALANVRSVEIFGDALHVLVDSAADAIPELRRNLEVSHANAAIRTVPASLEDAFVARLVA